MRLTAGTYTVVPRSAMQGTTRRMLSFWESTLMVVVPQGGQGTARRNALDAVRHDTVAARDRAEALAAIIAPRATPAPAAREPAAS